MVKITEKSSVVNMKDKNTIVSAQINAAKSQLESTDKSNCANQIEVAALRVAQAETAKNTVQRNFDNAKILFDAGVLSNEEYLNAKDALDPPS